MSAYLYSVGATAAIFTLLALSLNIITGYAGQAMMGHAAFFGIGAYTAAILTQTYHVNFFLALLIAMLFTGACGALLGLISLRLQADFLAITTIGINFVMVALFNNMSITGGSLGLTILKPMLFGTKMGNRQFFWLTFVVIVVVCLLIIKMRRSWFGMALASINNDSAAARSFGIQILSMVVIGGIGTIRGPIFGALLLTFLPEALRFADNYRSFVYGTLLVLMVRFMPSGLIGDNSPIVNGCRKLLQRITAKKEADKA